MKIFRLFVAFTLICFALSPVAYAVVPAPDGGYPGFTTAEGANALQNLTTGVGNTATGWHSLFANTAGNLNTGIGAGALLFNTGDNNTATGALALLSNTGGFYNTADGASALLSNTSGSGNTASGYQALYANHIGDNNAAFGYVALSHNSVSSYNTALGSQTLVYNDIGSNNTAVGYQALVFNISGIGNTAVGYQALANTTGDNNTALGSNALDKNTTGINNTVLGAYAASAVSTANDVICIGANVSAADVSHTAWIGNVYGVTTQSGFTAPVVVSDHGQLGTVASSERFKKDIATMEKASEAILSLRPVTFHYKTDTKETPQFGLIAEEAAKVNPALVLLDKEGKPYTVRYEAVNAMLLNEFLKEHRKNEKQEATIAELKKDLQANAAQHQKQIEALTVGLQRVKAQLELSKPAPQTAENNQ
jgi:endosialidase-like protein